MSSPKVALTKPSPQAANAPAGTAVRRSSTGVTAPASPTTRLAGGLKKLAVAEEASAARTPTAGASSPASRSRLTSSSPTTSSSGSSKLGAPSSPTTSSLASRTGVRSSTSTTSSSAMSTSTPVRSTTIQKAPVQSPTAAGMKMRPASGVGGVNALSTIGPSAMNAVSSSNPYSSTLAGSPPSGGAASPNSPIASASPNARRFKTAGTPTSSSTQPAAASSPIHSISPAGASSGGMSKLSYNSSTVASAGTGAGSYRATHPNAHAPVNTHAVPPPTHVADHSTPAGQIFSPVYSRTASQEQLRIDEEKKKGKVGGQATNAQMMQKQQEDEERYRQAVAAQAYAAQQAQQQAVLAAQQAAQQQQHTVSYTPPQVEEDEFDPFLFIKNLPPLSPAMRNRRSPLPKKSLKAPPITLALDLDETLVHCSVQPIDRAELTFKVAFNGMDYEVYVRTRPHMKEFLETVSQWFEVVIFTASQKVYADKLLNILDPEGKFIKYRIFRDSCVCVDGNYLKDLHILGREMPHVAIVDNSVQAFGFQLDNGIPIESWFDDDQDRELLNLIPFLRQLKDVKDVRPLIRDTFRLSEFVASL